MSFDPTQKHSKALLGVISLTLHDFAGACAFPLLITKATKAGYTRAEAVGAINHLARRGVLNINVVVISGERVPVVEAL